MNGDNHIEIELRRMVLAAMQKVAPAIEAKAREILRAEIENREAVRSLKRGKLRAEFGIEDVSDVDAIVDVWVRSLSVKVVVKGQKAALVMTAVDDLYLDVIGLSEASQDIGDGDRLDWLRFLLLVGDQPIVFGAYPADGNRVERLYSRSGTGTIMKKNKSREWGVPSEFAGTINNNFMTRLCDQLEERMAALMMEELSR